MGDICVEACIEIWQKQCVGQCEKEIDKCYNAAIETCKDAALTCALAAAACALLPATGPGVLGCALAAVPCLENFDDCLDGGEAAAERLIFAVGYPVFGVFRQLFFIEFADLSYFFFQRNIYVILFRFPEPQTVFYIFFIIEWWLFISPSLCCQYPYTICKH